jgi:hypothetical protein
MSLARRIAALERARDRGSCGPGCPPVAWKDFLKEGDRLVPCGWHGTPPTAEDLAEPAPCPRCGRPAVVVEMVTDPDFFGNADRLAEPLKP